MRPLTSDHVQEIHAAGAALLTNYALGDPGAIGELRALGLPENAGPDDIPHILPLVAALEQIALCADRFEGVAAEDGDLIVLPKREQIIRILQNPSIYDRIAQRIGLDLMRAAAAINAPPAGVNHYG